MANSEELLNNDNVKGARREALEDAVNAGWAKLSHRGKTLVIMTQEELDGLLIQTAQNAVDSTQT